MQPRHREVDSDLVAGFGGKGEEMIAAAQRLPASKVVGIPSLQARPLHDGTSIGTVLVLVFRSLWPAGWRVLPCLLAPVHRQVEQTVAVIHRLDAAPRRPVGLEDLGSLSQITNNV